MDEDLVKGEEELVKAAERWGEADRLAPGHEATSCTQESNTVSRSDCYSIYTNRAVTVLAERLDHLIEIRKQKAIHHVIPSS